MLALQRDFDEKVRKVSPAKWFGFATPPDTTGAGTRPAPPAMEEGEETIEEGKDKEELAADLALITAAQEVEHYEIAGYGTVRALARQLGELEVATLLSNTLGEEERADYLLTAVAKRCAEM